MFTALIQDTPWPEKPGTRTAVGPFYGGSDARCIAELASPGQLLVVITADTSSALALERELPFYLDGDLEILAFPDWETLPYDNFSPHQDIISERLSTLHRLPHCRGGILVVPVPTLMHRLPPTHYVAGSSLVLEEGQSIDLDSFRRDLERNGYRNVDTVFEHGEFALRGSLFDIYPMGSSLPFRIDLLDDEVDTLRTFDPENQLTVDKVSAINLLPAREYPLDSRAITRFQMNWWETFDVDHDSCPTYSEVSAGRSPGGCEYYLPLFFEHCATLFDYFPDNTALIVTGDHHHAAEHFWHEVGSRFEEYGIDPRRPLLPPRQGFTPVEEFYHLLGKFPVLELRHTAEAPVHQKTAVLPPPDLATDQTVSSAAANLAGFINEHGGPVLLCAETAGRREILLQSLREHGLTPPTTSNWHSFLASGEPFAIATAPLDRGLYFGPGKPTLVCEAQLFGNRVAQRRRRRASAEATNANVFRDINELREGVPVVHLEHGVGRYVGLQSLTVDEQETEFLTLEYARGSTLYVPVASLHLISRYAGSDPDLAPLHTLGSEQWDKARRKASEKANDIAAQLLEVYARREARKGFAFEVDPITYDQFSAAFPFEETPDQEVTIKAVIDDMRNPRVMDRLVCGDVGFGKTEVAMRAAFVATQNRKQVAVLVPTTLLAQQHFSSFSDRFADWPVNVEVVSRFKSAAQMREVSKRIAEGKIDILVGTHKLLQSDFHFDDLGLLIIDEEHRFGVKQKEAIKALRSEVDILTLTATPIPRTLNMALGGMRDLSIIATPPARRLSIKTFVREHNVALIKEAVLRETLRGGQVYYLHNEVKSIEESARKLRELVPELTVGVAHGQMRETELEQVMSAFYHQRHHILLCTTIIETGIDIPNANTIIIERADKFGLAQLHQLRGRVGRSHHQAYAYLLTPPRSAITADAGKRLEAIEAAGDLGAGYMLATHDLEIRGAGELLGDEQSGQIHSVGFSLYMDMLERAVAALKRGEIPDVDAPLDAGTEVNLHVPALIPGDYLPDINTRLVLYKRIAAAADDDQLRELQVEMIDRFGLLPEQVSNLFLVSRLRLRAESLGIRAIEAGASGGSIDFKENTRVNPMSLVNLVQSDPRSYKLAGATRLRFEQDLDDKAQRVQYVETLLDRFANDATENAA
ncbi:transcription-repair coupling factor [Pseudohalioglobus lutimaris]|uniref:Transcription-repair-coupling factor n=1 Tax=Pseudohalioglobus lutimaris TaxID=1737061 RepID=A0A2N5X4U0_9GAMM|nr:transcription-repair coupling factor [Pseudohalioglobus lutimaris]PLW69493.1 transcription-repair coupling factor [Pseudohalioglobus lutimaris]